MILYIGNGCSEAAGRAKLEPRRITRELGCDSPASQRRGARLPGGLWRLEVANVLGMGVRREPINDVRNEYLRADVHIVGLLPTRVDRRYQMTEAVLAGLAALSAQISALVLPGIRTDATAGKSLCAHKPLAEFAPESKIWVDYQAAFAKLLEVLNGQETAAA